MKIIKVEACRDCPYLYEMGTRIGHMCKEVQYKIIKEQNSIPEWCPLDDDKEKQ